MQDTALFDISKSLDGAIKLLDSKPWVGQLGCTSRVVELLPGEHTIMFNYALSGPNDIGRDPASITFMAEPDGRYELLVKRIKRDRYSCSVVEAESRRVVAEKWCEFDPARMPLLRSIHQRFRECGVHSLYNASGTWFGFEKTEDYRTSVFLQWLDAEQNAGLWLTAARSNGYPVPEGALDFYSATLGSSKIDTPECRLPTVPE